MYWKDMLHRDLLELCMCSHFSNKYLRRIRWVGKLPAKLALLLHSLSRIGSHFYQDYMMWLFVSVVSVLIKIKAKLGGVKVVQD